MDTLAHPYAGRLGVGRLGDTVAAVGHYQAAIAGDAEELFLVASSLRYRFFQVANHAEQPSGTLKRMLEERTLCSTLFSDSRLWL
jgi:hypothetical protein